MMNRRPVTDAPPAPVQEDWRAAAPPATETVTQPRVIEGQKPSFEILPVEIIVPAHKQRPERRGWVVRHAKEGWHEEWAGAISVNVRAGDPERRYCFDGMHRVQLARALDQQTIRAATYHGLTLVDEAANFEGINGSQQPASAFERFDARLGRNDPSALDIERIVATHGMRITTWSGIAKPYLIRSVVKLDEIYAIGPEWLDQTLHVIRESWNNEQTDAVNGGILKGMFWLLYNHCPRDVSEDRIVTILKRVSPGAIIVAARNNIARRRLGGSALDAHYVAMVDALNSQRRGNTAFLEYRPTSRRGADQAGATLTQDQVDLIRHLSKQGVQASVIARDMTIPTSTVFDIIHNRTWTG